MKIRTKKKIITSFLLGTFMMSLIAPPIAKVAAAEAAQVRLNYNEQYRPQFHFTPEKNWMNDPNGLVYYDGEYHLFYQHNPTDNNWGDMYWGHAVSTDLVNWEQLPMALFPDEVGYQWSGNIIIDWNNTAGFGNEAMIAIYTTERGAENQHVNLAYSTDKGRTWTKHEGNPVIAMPEELKTSTRVFRDPKVFWHEETRKWVMVIATGNQAYFYNSDNLKEWTKTSEFGLGQGGHSGVWECPDIFELPVDGDSSKKKWVMIMSTNGGAPAGGNGIQYFIGDFDGKKFTNENSADIQMWMDYGDDTYAGATYGDIPSTDGRRIFLAWMNSPNKYGGDIPTTPWKSSMIVPRQLTLKTTANGVRMAQSPVVELQSLRDGVLKEVSAPITVEEGNEILKNVTVSTFEIEAEFSVNDNTTAADFGFKVRKADNIYTTIGYTKEDSKVYVDRTISGNTSFNTRFPGIHTASLIPENNIIKLNVLVDNSSVEVFANNGLVSITDQIFPDPSATAMELFAEGGQVILNSLTIHKIKGSSFTKYIAPYPTNAPNVIENPSFETGDLSGWTAIGGAFQGAITNEYAYGAGQTSFEKVGDYHLFGLKGAKDSSRAEWRTGELKSSCFTLGGNGTIDFLVGAGGSINKTYVALVRASDDQVLFQEVGPGTDTYKRVRWRVEDYLGEVLYIKVVDYDTNRHINVDDFNVYSNSEIIPTTITNSGFETGDITGWTVIEGNAFGPNSVSADTIWWGERIPYNQEGAYHLNGWRYPESEKGRLRSSTFELGGTGWITFKLGGGKTTDLCNIQVFDADTQQLIAKYGNRKFADINFPHIDQGMNLANMVQYRADLSGHIGKNMYIEIVDNAVNDWGVMFADDFNTYHETIPTEGAIAFDISKPITNEIENPNFETGDLRGWTIKGNAFGVSDVTTYWGTRLFNQEGQYHMWGFVNAGDDGQGEMKSNLFKLGGNGTINFLVGGGKDISNLYVTLVRAEDGTELAGCKSTGVDDEGYMRVTWDASPYLGEIVYIKVADKRGGGFGHINVDDFQVYNVDAAMPDSIQNANFETGDLTGWTANGEAFANAVTDEAESDGVNIGKEGQYHLWPSDKDKVGDLKSSDFYLAGTGAIKMLLAGNSDAENLYVALVKAQDNTELLKVSNATDSYKYKEVTINASRYVGTKVYIKIVDKSTQGFISVDDIRVKNFGAVAEWSFNEGSGKVANDTASNTKDQIEYVFNDAKYKPSSDPKWMDGIMDSALLFDGYSTSITREADKFTKPSNAITVEGWVAPRTYEYGDLGQMSIIVNQHNKSRGEGFALGIGRHGAWSLQIGVDKSWFELWADSDKPIELNKWSYITAAYDRDTQTMKLYLNGQLAGQRRVPLSGFITPSTEPLIIGRHNQAAVLNGSFFANMFDGLMDELKISYAPVTDEEVAEKYNNYMEALDNILPEPQLALDRSDYDGDMYRPQYHFMPPGNWMNEPHGPIYYNGKYHIFYQANPRGPYWHYINWGHAVSDDMVHWEEQPIAIMPEAGSVAPDGVWSGSTTYDKDGKPVIFFTAGDDSRRPNQSTGIAIADNYSDPNLKNWTMQSELVTVQTENIPGQNPGEVAKFGDFRDPFVFKDGDTWYQLVGSGIQKDGKNISGTALVYKSKDLTNWEYMGPLFQIDRTKYVGTGTVWELPVLLPLNDGEGTFSGKHILLINPSNFESELEAMKYGVKNVFYWIGTWNKETGRFTPDHEEPKLFDYGEHFTGPSGMVDDKGRTIVFSIAQDTRSEQAHFDSGWAHNAGLPLELNYEDNTLRIKPIEEELSSLRRDKLVDFSNKSIAEANALLKDVRGDMLEISVELKAKDADKYGIKVRRSPDGQEETLLFYDETSQTYNVDRNKTTLSPDARKGINGGSLELNGNTLKLHIYIDRSMIEAYANGLKSITTRAYPTRFDALGLQIWGNGDVMVKSMQVWEMGSAYGEVVPVVAKSQDTKVKWGNIANAGFETGDLTGWTIEGNAFTKEMVTDATDWGWGGPFNQAVGYGESTRYHLWGFIAPENGGLGDAGIGAIKSKNFTLGGDGKISFLVGGGQNIDRLYVALVKASDGTILMKATGRNTEQYGRVTWDASKYIGEELYIKVVDDSTGGFGHINVDDFHVPVDAKVIMNIPNVNVELIKGEKYLLPEKVTAIMSDGSEELISVNWIPNSVDTSKVGAYAYSSSVEGYQGEAILFVTVDKDDSGSKNDKRKR
jgi:fructan beta-fructosidase